MTNYIKQLAEEEEDVSLESDKESESSGKDNDKWVRIYENT